MRSLRDNSIYYLNEGNRRKHPDTPTIQTNTFIPLDDGEFLLTPNYYDLKRLTPAGLSVFSEALAERLGVKDSISWILPLNGQRIGVATNIGFFYLDFEGHILFHFEQRKRCPSRSRPFL